MNSMQTIDFESLPARAAASIGRENFLYSYYIPEKNRYVIHHVNQATKDGEEIEFDVASDRFLTLDERLRELPNPATKAYSDKDVFAYATYRIEQQSNELWVHFDIYSASDNKKITEADQHVYSPIKWDNSSVIASAVEKANFPLQYACWDEDQKVRYWAGMIHRFRRWNGESGLDEDEVFAPSLLHDMEKTDPNVRFLLPKILALAARLEQTEPEILIRSFSKRVGIEIS
ncbi:MAG: hypothetical protein J2P21_11340 [Chloracidobacterium sp.]|nr:hypothetical protein [Chloracidobacterium sp.]